MPARMAMTDRNHLIRLIHVARRDLQMADDTYRAIVAQYAAGKTSSSDCDLLELETILAHLKRAGFKVRKPTRAKPTEPRPLDMADESKKVRALWLLLHRLGAVHDPSESALATYVRRQAGVDDLRWAGRKMYPLIEGLKAWAKRVFPAQLQVRLHALQAAGVIDPRNTLPALYAIAAPRRDPKTFDAMWFAWEYLDAQEREAHHAGCE